MRQWITLVESIVPPTRITKRVLRMAYDAMELDSFSEDAETASQADEAMRAFMSKTISREQIINYYKRRVDYLALR